MEDEERFLVVKPPSTIIKLPAGLLEDERVKAYSWREWRRRVYVYYNAAFLPVPGKDYGIDGERGELSLPYPLRDLDVITISVPHCDERWYYTPAGGWGRM